MSKIKAYLDADILFKIIDGKFDAQKNDCISSMQAITELFVKYNLTKQYNEVFCLITQNVKIRCIDYEVLEKFSQIYDENPKNTGLFLQYSVALLEDCKYFITNQKSLQPMGIETILPEELANSNKAPQSAMLFDF